MKWSRRKMFAHAIAIGSLEWFRAKAWANTVTYTYDDLGRIRTATYPDGRSVSYAYDAAGNRTQVVENVPANPPPIGSLSANPSTITVGQSTTLTWTSANATSASINGVGAVTPVAGGTVSVSPSTTTTYTLTLSGPGGTITPTASVTVNPAAFNQTIAVPSGGPVNLRTLANNLGYSGAQNANIVFEVNSGTVIGSAGSATAGQGGAGSVAIDSGDWPTSLDSIALSLVVKTGAAVRGGGGAGGKGGGVSPTAGSAGGAGGDAIYCRLPMSVTVQSGAEIRAGGGGGGGGGRASFSHPGGTGYVGGGGGGGGYPNGGSGLGGTGVSPGGNGTNGSPGTSSGGGAAGGGGPVGGAGGASGANGSNGWNSASSGGAGGAAGYAIRKNGHNVTVSNSGTITGTQA